MNINELNVYSTCIVVDCLIKQIALLCNYLTVNIQYHQNYFPHCSCHCNSHINYILYTGQIINSTYT